MFKKCLEVRCKTSGFYFLNFLAKKTLFINQDERVGGVNKQIRRSCWRSKAVHCKLISIFTHLFLSFFKKTNTV